MMWQVTPDPRGGVVLILFFLCFFIFHMDLKSPDNIQCSLGKFMSRGAGGRCCKKAVRELLTCGSCCYI